MIETFLAAYSFWFGCVPRDGLIVQCLVVIWLTHKQLETRGCVINTADALVLKYPVLTNPSEHEKLQFF